MSRNIILVRSSLHPSRLLCAVLITASLIMAATSEEINISKSNNQFGIDLFKQVAKDDSNKLISPFSAHVVLSMAYQGAGGETLKNMAHVLGLPDPPTTAAEYNKVVTDLNRVKNVTLNIANKIYIKEKFHLKPAFKDVIEKKFLSEAEEINFEQNTKAANEINSWVEKKTNNKIKELIKADMLDASTRLVLLNAVYFKGNWLKKFSVAQTEKKPFHLLNGEEIQVDMMSQSGKFKYSENADLGCKILELPYEGNELSMIIFLPNEHNGITSLQQKLSSFDMNTISQELAFFTVNVELPKFRIESTIPLKQALIDMGAGEMFTDKADFHNMADQPLKVSDVIQKTFIEVNEEGAEAAAATAMDVASRFSDHYVHDFIVSHPFVFFVRDNSRNTIIFIGNIVKPFNN